MDALTIAILFGHLLLGVVFCFFGNKWLKIILAVYGFAAGFVLSFLLLPHIASLSETLFLLISIGVGVVGALLFVFLLYIGIFFIGFGGGLLLCVLAVSVFNLNILDWFVYVPIMIVSSLLGTLTLNNRRIFISVFTSFIGASALAQFIYQIISGISIDALLLKNEQAIYATYSSTVYLVSLAVLFVSGLVVQLLITSKKKI